MRSPHQKTVVSTDSQPLTPKRTTWNVVRRVAVYLYPYPWLAFGTIACAVISLGCAFVYPKLTQWVVDSVINGHQHDKLFPSMIGLAAAFFCRELFNSLRICLNNTLEQHVIFDLRRDLYSRLQHLPVSYFDQRASGDLMTRVVEDVNSVERVLIDGTEQGVVSLLSVTGVMAILFYTQPWLAAAAVIPLPFLAGGALWYTFTAHARYRAQRDASSALNALLMDNLQGIRQIKVFGRELHENERFSQKANMLRTSMLKIMFVWAIYSPSMSFISAVGIVSVLWLGGHQVMMGQLTVGELLGFILYLSLFYEPMGRLHGLNQMLQSARAAGERVFDILDSEPEEKQTERKAVLRTPVQGAVVFDHVGFSYIRQQPGCYTLDQIHIQAHPGEVVALVGPTGSGKSTVANLLMGMYKPDSGRILVDGQDIGSVSLESLRASVSLVSQEPFLFNGTVRENIQYGKLDASQDELENAIRMAHCDLFIQKLPKGLDTNVGERGVKLSVGEKQRISIARALLKDAPILVLDEATASVDTQTEKIIQQALDKLMVRRTCFVIAHRLSTIQRAQQILVLEHGKIIERGSHEALLAENGLYARLVRIQHIPLVEDMFDQIQKDQG